jgi:hypothetical protein
MVWGNILQAVQRWSDVQRSKAKEGGVRHVCAAVTEDDANETDNRFTTACYVPVTCTHTLRSRGPSNSQKNTDCQVPKHN